MTYAPPRPKVYPRLGVTTSRFLTTTAGPRQRPDPDVGAVLAGDDVSPIHMRRSVRGDYTLVSLSGELDLATADDALDYLHGSLIETGSRLVLDLYELKFTDAFGLDGLLALGQRAAELGGWVRLARVSDRIQLLIDILSLTNRLPTFASVTAAASGVVLSPAVAA